MSNNSTAVSNVIPFAFEAKSVRVQEIDGSPWFCVTDVCSILGYSNSRDAMSKHCREKGVAKRDTLTSKGKQVLTFIDEGNLYRLIIKSRKEEAQRFESWVCDEVLPAIRKTGTYIDTSNKMSTLVDDVIGVSGTNLINGVIGQKVATLPVGVQRQAKHKLHAILHTRFNVPRTELIPAGKLDVACEYLAAYALEGEFLPKPEKVEGGIHLSRYETQHLYLLMSRFFLAGAERGRLHAAAIALDSEPLKKVWGQLHEGVFSFAALDKRRAEIYGEYCALGMTGGYAMLEVAA